MVESFQRYWHGDDGEIRLLFPKATVEDFHRNITAAAGSVLTEALLIGLALWLPAGMPSSVNLPGIEGSVPGVTPLIAPPPDVMKQFRFTQKEPQQGKPATEVNLAGLLPRPAMPQSPSGAPLPPGRPLFAPPPSPPPSAPRIEPPKIEVPAQGMSQAPNSSPPITPPPPEKPKLALENVGPPPKRPSGSPSGTGRLESPKTTVDDAIRALARSGGAGSGVAVGDAGVLNPGDTQEMLRQMPLPGRPGSALQLLSDAQGVDFKPYLIQVLTAVRKNWMAVLPESARFGQRGRVIIQFSVNRTGQVPKLVIAAPSGTLGLDRAAVAGISASIPFPPLPVGFQGSEIRLQLVFNYNMPAQ
jgi:TonB family protein